MGYKSEEWPIRISSENGKSLEAYLSRSSNAGSKSKNGVLLLHGFPAVDVPAAAVGANLSELSDRITNRLGCFAMAIRFQGCGRSEGNFSLQSWVEDSKSAISYLKEELEIRNVWICGFGTGGALGIVAAASSDSVSGVAAISSPADFDDWAENPGTLLGFARKSGVISSEDFPEDMGDWKAELREIRAVEKVEEIADKSLLILHGSDDKAVPHFDARLLADAHGSADLRFVAGGSHKLRQDPRAVAILLSWLDREQILGGAVEESILFEIE